MNEPGRTPGPAHAQSGDEAQGETAVRARKRRKRAPAEPFSALIGDLDHEGRGVARKAGKVTFVHGALPAEQVTARVVRRRRQFDEAALLSVDEASADRVAPACAHFDVCGGCALQHLDPAAQVRHKQAGLMENLTRIGGVSPAAVMAPIVAASYGYRRRARLAAKHVPGKGGVLVGFRERHAPYIAVLDSCEVLHPTIARRIGDLRETLSSMDARARIPQLEVAVGDDAAAIVVRHLDPLSEGDVAVLRRFARAHDIQIYLQAGGPETVVALEPVHPPPLGYRLAAHGVQLEFGPTDFVQVNASVNEALIDCVIDRLDLCGTERVLDLYCGLGNFTLPVARRAASVYGIEGAPALVTRARANARRNRIDNASFDVSDLSASAPLAELLGSQHAPAFDRLLLDPPRAGAAAVCEALMSAQAERSNDVLPTRIVYVSCHPATLARDAGQLVNKLGYSLAQAGVADMFPHTNHVESVAVFERGARA